MPNRIACWDAIHNSGNPTKSKEVNQLIKFVKKKEVRKQGKAPCTKRALTQEEFRDILIFFKEKNNFQFRYRYYSMLLYQYYLIARCDDVAHFKIRDLHGHTNPLFSSFALQTKVTWSKNVYEERDCPDQIFFGSFDSQYCLLLSLSIYLEVWLGDNIANTNKFFLFGDDDENDIRAVDRIKNNYSATLRKYFVEFVRLSRELGTHSIRKFAASWARALGCLIDEIDSRGRWRKGSRKIVDRYINVEQQFLDAKVAAALCVGGAIKYCLVEGSAVTSTWLEEHVVPGISDYFDDASLVFVLSLPLLWMCLNDELVSDYLPLTLSTRVREAYEVIRVLDVSINPVKRVFLSIVRANDQVIIDEMMEVTDEHGVLQQNNNTTNNNNRVQQQDHINILFVQMQQLKHQFAIQYEQLQQSTNNLRTDFAEKYKILNKNINRVFIQPPRQGTQRQREEREARNNFEAAAEALVGPVLVAELSRAPKTIFDVWMEYAFGIGGRKPAKDFTSLERGANRFAYCRRKVVWDCISKHVNAGFLAATAIDRILECYGRNQNVSAIITAMVNDKKRGGHPNLRV
jgi:hypothetical protein